jgi:hypothetical protein
MNPRNSLSFFKTKSGRMIVFGALFAAGLIIFSVLRKHQTAGEDTVEATSLAGTTNKPQVVQSVIRAMLPYNPPPAKPETISGGAQGPTGSSQAVADLTAANLGTTNVGAGGTGTDGTGAAKLALAAQASRQVALPPPICLFADSTAGSPRPKRLSSIYAPFGRLIPCETITTVDSSTLETPIIGLITENVYFGGRLVIPAGTEVHGTAQTDHQRERIGSGTSWTLVWQTGEELQLKAIALDREFDNSTNMSGWSLTDGSAGLRGEIIKTDNLAEIKLFAATFLSGAASALTAQQETVFGPINSPTLNNAPFAGAQSVLQTYAQHIYDSIQKDGFYVRVPSGKQFYLYVLQTIDRADASFGGAAIPTPNSTPANP